MEINQYSSTRKSDQIVCTSDEPYGSGHARSYTCTFCKRGFSNAQALGGHMNIHRKDRAKLKQASDETLLSLDITRSANPSDFPQDSEDKSLFLLESSEERSKEDARPRNKDGSEELQQLPCYVDTKVSSCPVGEEEKQMQLNHGSSQAELDLELRLGPLAS